MSRSYVTLAAVLIAVAGLIGIVQVTGSDDEPTTPVAAEQLPVSDVDGDTTGDDAAPAGVSDTDAETDTAVPETELAAEVRDELGLEPIAVVDPDCTLSVRLELDQEHDEVACLESQLIAAGALVNSSPDSVFDQATDLAVRAFQEQNGLVVDGVVGPQTASQLGSWVGPDVLPPNADTCDASGRAAVVDRFNQRAWLCEDGEITQVMPMTSAISQPDPGTYEVYAKDRHASSNISGGYSEMEYFVAFTHGKYQGARIAFHSIPTYSDGEFVQPLESVGTSELHGASAGCIRVLPEDAKLIYSWLEIGDTVTVVT